MSRFKNWLGAFSLGRKVAYGAISLLAAVSVVGASSPSTTQPTPKAQSAPLQAKVELKTVTEKQPIDFPIQNVDDATILKGQSAVKQEGKAGEKTLVYEITYSDGHETARKVVSDTISTQPTSKVIAIGTRVDTPALSNNNTYTNTDGNTVHSPAYSSQVPAGATAVCGDGTYSFSQNRSGTCSHHGGVAQWL